MLVQQSGLSRSKATSISTHACVGTVARGRKLRKVTHLELITFSRNHTCSASVGQTRSLLQKGTGKCGLCMSGNGEVDTDEP